MLDLIQGCRFLLRGCCQTSVPAIYSGISPHAIRIAAADCHEIVMVVRSERIISKQKGSNRLICNPLRNIVKQKIFLTVQNPLVYC